ncbi:peptidyl-prolyl cis-trans isomerase [Roseovarius pacificus]|uniref:peptidyl-prolyl cis-trans isomerase n=1 Tax=Roseovarius pacificus TaxID=337701 RepID=UPI002A18E082|nr:peptidyl-prolyl cis-trans isomerase [Roseovarius pacificus]
MAAKSISKTLVWILMGLLILGLGGFGVTNLSGGVSSIGSVGDTKIDINDYARALQSEMDARQAATGEPMTLQQARQNGVTDAVLARMIATAALDDETARLGISIGDENLRRQILEIQGFQGINGTFDREAYAFALDRTGLSETQFEENMRTESARAILQGAVMAGITVPEGYIRPLMTYLAEQRDATWAILDRADLQTGLPDPTEEELKAYHQSHLPDFTTPTVKQITYAYLTPEMIIDSVEVDEQALRDAYDERIEEYRQPERRLVERLVFADSDSASAALARIESGEIGFEALVEERGLSLADVDMGDVAKDDLAAGSDAVFSAGVGDVVGPLDSDLGPALFRVNAILAAQETTFDEAEAELRDELASGRARRVIETRISDIDDLLAGGATLEDLGAETDMQTGTLDWHPGMSDGIAAYAAFRSAAEAVSDSDYPEVMDLDDGGIFAMRLDKVIDPEIQPLDDVRPAVVAGWRQQATAEALKTQAEAQIEELRGGADFDDLGLETQSASDLTRQGFQPGTPPGFVETLFGMDKGDVSVIEADGRIFVLRLDDIRAPDTDTPELEALQAGLREQAASGLSQDLFQILANDIRERAGLTIDQQAINAVHANFQ